MRLLLDEMLSPEIAAALRRRGHDATSVKEEADWAGSSDREVFELARSEGRAIVTSNLRDYRPLHQQSVAQGGDGHFGMIFMPTNDRRTAKDVGRIVGALECKLAEFPGAKDLADRETWLST